MSSPVEEINTSQNVDLKIEKEYSPNEKQKEETKEENQKETKEENLNETKDSTKKGTKEENLNETKDSTKKEIKEENLNETKDKADKQPKETRKKNTIEGRYDAKNSHISWLWNVTETRPDNFDESLVYLLYLIKTDKNIKELKKIELKDIHEEIDNIDIMDFPWHLLSKNLFNRIFNLMKTESIFYISGYYRIATSMGKSHLINALYEHFQAQASLQK